MTEQRVTLEDVATCIEAGLIAKPLEFVISGAGRRISKEAAVCRAAQDVVDEARFHECKTQKNADGTTYCLMCMRLAALDKAERGE